MPKANSALSSTPTKSDHLSARMSDVALRKKKNADAQAAFRARRANYIATLEETVTNLESVVLQLQDSCREARNESQEARQENARLRFELREREKFWKAVWPRKTGSDDLPPPPPPFPSQPGGANGHMGSAPIHQYGNEGMGYRANDDPSICNGQYGTANHSFPNHSPSVPYPGVEHELPGDNSSHNLAHRTPKYPHYFPPIHDSRDGPWPQTIAQSSSSGGDSGVAPSSNHSSNSPHFVESPSLTSSEMSFVGRFPVEEQKVPMNNVDTAPYVFSGSRSISPSASTPPSSSTTMSSTFPFTFPDNSATAGRTEFDYRRQTHPHPAEVTLHGGTADISMAGTGADAVRYRLGTRRANSGADNPLLPILPPLCGSDNGSPNDRGSSDGESAPYQNARLRSRRSTAASRTSRSPSPGSAPPLSGTLAVIKAQAFGALRRTRARTKKSSDGAAKVAIDVLEARGIGMGAQVGNKRQRLDDDLDEQQS